MRQTQLSLPLTASRPKTSPAAVQALPPEAVAHREAFVRYVLENATPWHRTYLGRLYRLWEEWSREYFTGHSLVPPYILLSEPAQSRCYGVYNDVSAFGGHGQIRIRPSLLTGRHPHLRPEPEFVEGRFLFVADVLLHEMNHQYQHEVTGKVEDYAEGHGPAFRDRCNEIGKKLGLAPVREARKSKQQPDLPSCAQWPHNVRPAGYYLGAYDYELVELNRPSITRIEAIGLWAEMALIELENGELSETKKHLVDILFWTESREWPPKKESPKQPLLECTNESVS